MFKQTVKTKGKTAKPLAIPGAKKKASKSTAAHGRGHVSPQQAVKTPQQIAQDSVDMDAEDLTGDDSDESRVEDAGNDDGHEDDGAPCIENCASIADAIGKVSPKRKASRKYDSGTNTYR